MTHGSVPVTRGIDEPSPGRAGYVAASEDSRVARIAL
jgi:hypothetical protein